MELGVAVAVGLNPYVAGFVFAALAAFSRRIAADGSLALSPNFLIPLAFLLGLAAPFDLVFGKFLRLAPRLRRLSHLMAALTAGTLALYCADLGLPPAVGGVLAGALALAVALLLTHVAARASRSPEWGGWGHVPVLMAATTAAACIVPLYVASPVIGAVAALTAVVVLLLAELLGRRGRRHMAYRPAPDYGRPIQRAPSRFHGHHAPTGAGL